MGFSPGPAIQILLGSFAGTQAIHGPSLGRVCSGWWLWPPRALSCVEKRGDASQPAEQKTSCIQQQTAGHCAVRSSSEPRVDLSTLGPSAINLLSPSVCPLHTPCQHVKGLGKLCSWDCHPSPCPPYKNTSKRHFNRIRWRPLRVVFQSSGTRLPGFQIQICPQLTWEARSLADALISPCLAHSPVKWE